MAFAVSFKLRGNKIWFRNHLMNIFLLVHSSTTNRFTFSNWNFDLILPIIQQEEETWRDMPWTLSAVQSDLDTVMDSPRYIFCITWHGIFIGLFQKHVNKVANSHTLMIHAAWKLGKVTVDGRVVNKAGTPISDKANVEIIAEIPKYVCRWLLQRINSLQNLTCDLFSILIQSWLYTIYLIL